MAVVVNIRRIFSPPEVASRWRRRSWRRDVETCRAKGKQSKSRFSATENPIFGMTSSGANQQRKHLEMTSMGTNQNVLNASQPTSTKEKFKVL